MKRSEFTTPIHTPSLMNVFSVSRYELPQPAAAQRNDLSAWVESVENSMAQLEHQSGRCAALILALSCSIPFIIFLYLPPLSSIFLLLMPVFCVLYRERSNVVN